jgi:beta-lactamase class A
VAVAATSFAVTASLAAGDKPAGAEPAADGDPASGTDPGTVGARKVWPPVRYPPRRAVEEAQSFIAARGDASFAVIDSRGRLQGYEADRQYSAASASKSLLLAAELLRLRREGEPLDSSTRSLLEPMITYSDNGAASGVYARVGDAGLEEVARRAGMRDFEVDPGFWGGAQITAADMARFFYRLPRNLAGRYRGYGLRLLASVTPTQRWGIPTAAGPGWRIWFKGGWRPPGQEGTTGAVTHQAALLVHRSGHRLALAVLTNEAPGTGAGYDAIEGVTARLLKEPPRARRWPAP